MYYNCIKVIILGGKKMKRIFAIILVLSFISGISYAHAPFKIDAAYEKETETLFVVVHHPVRNPKEHFIEKISVNAGTNIFLYEEYERQTNEKQEVLKMYLPKLKVGDRIFIKADCFLIGKKSKSIKVE